MVDFLIVFCSVSAVVGLAYLITRMTDVWITRPDHILVKADKFFNAIRVYTHHDSTNAVTKLLNTWPIKPERGRIFRNTPRWIETTLWRQPADCLTGHFKITRPYNRRKTVRKLRADAARLRAFLGRHGYYQAPFSGLWVM